MSITNKILVAISIIGILSIFLALKNFVTHPYYNKSNISYAINSLTKDSQDYDILINYVESLVKKDSVFRFENHPKQGVNLLVLD